MARILVADDDEDIRLLVAMRLRRSGHVVELVGDGDSVVRACSARVPDLAILDVMMPGRSGLDACRLLRADARMPRFPIIMLSALARPRDREVGLAAGADAYMVKPFSPSVLAERVAALLAIGRAA